MSTGQGLLERRLLVATGAVALRSADHHQALAEVADVDLERRQLPIGQSQAGDVDEDHAVVAGKAGEIGRERLGDDRVDLLALVSQGRDQLDRDRVVAGQDQGSRLALDDGVRVGAIVLAERVESGLDDCPEADEPGLDRLDVGERDRVQPGDQLDRLGLDQRPVGEEADRRGLGDRRADLDDHRHGLAQPRGRRRRQPLDEHLLDIAKADAPRFDLHAARRRQCGLGLSVAGRVVAVGEQDDPLLRVVGEEGRGEPQGSADIGRRADRGGRQPVDLGQLGREPLDQCALAERNDPGHVAVGAFLERLTKERERVLAPRVADRIGEVDDEDRRQPVDRQDQLEPGQREHEGREQQRPNDQGRPSTPRAHPAPSPDVETDGQQKRGDQQEQRERRVERDAHQALPSGAFRPNRAPRPRRMRVSASRW